MSRPAQLLQLVKYPFLVAGRSYNATAQKYPFTTGGLLGAAEGCSLVVGVFLLRTNSRCTAWRKHPFSAPQCHTGSLAAVL